MKRTWLIGAALVFSLTAVGCDDDDGDGPVNTADGGDAGHTTIDAGGLDSSLPGADAGDAGDAG